MFELPCGELDDASISLGRIGTCDNAPCDGTPGHLRATFGHPPPVMIVLPKCSPDETGDLRNARDIIGVVCDMWQVTVVILHTCVMFGYVFVFIGTKDVLSGKVIFGVSDVIFIVSGNTVICALSIEQGKSVVLIFEKSFVIYATFEHFDLLLYVFVGSVRVEVVN